MKQIVTIKIVTIMLAVILISLPALQLNADPKHRNINNALKNPAINKDLIKKPATRKGLRIDPKVKKQALRNPIIRKDRVFYLPTINKAALKRLKKQYRNDGDKKPICICYIDTGKCTPPGCG